MLGMKTLCKPALKVALAGGFLTAAAAFSAGAARADSANWDALAQCESGGNWSANTGNGFYGGLQILQTTWDENGGVGSPAKASKQEQKRVADRILATQGPGAWPKCSHVVTLPSEPHARHTVKKIISKFLPHL